MSSTLRSRLWWSYALVTAAALAVVAVILLIYIIQNPSTYRQANARLTVVTALMRKNETDWASLTRDALQAQIERIDDNYDIRIIIYNNKRQVMADSRSAQQSPLKMPFLPRLRVSSVLRDQNGQYWLYVVQHLGSGRWLLVTVPRPAVPFLTVLSDELMLPVFIAAIVALTISLLVAFWLARWVGDPLQQIVAASRQMPSAQAKLLVPRGPHEVQELTQAFNEMNSRVQASQKSQREFVANVSHELKTPLTSVQGFAQAILDGTADTPESRQQAARVIYDEAGRMHRMVLDLLELARLDAGTLDLQHLPVDLPALLNNVAEKFTPQARAAQLSIRVETTALPTVTGDGDRLAQIFTNLVDNALKNTPAGGSVTLRAALTGSEVQVNVVDSGAGISSEALPHIFERFFQADTSRPGGEKHGTGLGLAIVREIVKAHGGKISVCSAPGTGSTFTVTLPLTVPDTSSVIRHKK
jgi:signal transduction histidine kinase